jgi:hypothetical protein
VRRFTCQVCGAEAPFDAGECTTCGTELGFFPGHGEVLPVRSDSGAGYRPPVATVDGTIYWRCLNFAWGCNWMLPADRGAVWCASCRLTRGRPDESDADAVRTWSTTEKAKRRLVYQLRTLRLPIDPPSEDVGGVVFDLVYLPESRGVTGHRRGVVTIDLREADDRFRETARRQLHESNRTVIGHLRHEIGHHYWQGLVAGQGAIEGCRALFGDERADYDAAIARHYCHLTGAVPDTHISTYAAAHPSEDWAETFAHYLHIRDGLETADDFGVSGPGPLDSMPLAAMVARWRRLTTTVNELNRGLGHAAPYPFTIGPAVEAKLSFVHDRVLSQAALPT